MSTVARLHHRQTGLCPTLTEPSLQRDGLLLRVALVGGRLTADQLVALASVAESAGNGVVEVTNRANLQLRGFSDTSFQDAVRCCIDQGLADPAARVISTTCFAGEAEQTLRGELVTALADFQHAGLSPKFIVQIEDSSTRAPQRQADVRLRLCADSSGDVEVEVDVARRTLRCTPQEATALVAELVRRCSDAGPRTRVADLEDHILGAALAMTTSGDAAATQTPPSAPATVGLGVTTLTGAPWAVAGVRFGRLSSGLLRSLAELLQRTGTPWLAITPWRSLAIRCTGDTVASDMLGELVAIGFLPPHHPAAAVVVCVGASGCWQTELDTLAMAERVLAEAHDLGRGYWVHVSGCDKFCATRAAAPVTLVGRCDSSGFDTRRLDHAGREA